MNDRTVLSRRDGFCCGRRCDLLWIPDHDRGCSLAYHGVNLDLQKRLQAQQEDM
jgi:hypothetical protein